MIKFIKNLGTRRTNGYMRSWALYECPKCLELFESRVEKRDKKTCRNCVQRDGAKTHGLTGTPLYKIWESIKGRCYTKRNSAYKWYGAKGVLMCDEWKDDVATFAKWAISYGWKEDSNLHISRFNDVGNYEPSNCKVVTAHENLSEVAIRNNKRRALCQS